MFILRVLLKIILLPVSLIIFVLRCAVKLAVRITSALVGLFLIYVAACAVYCLVVKRWTDMMILLGIGGSVIAILFLCVLLDEVLEGLQKKIGQL